MPFGKGAPGNEQWEHGGMMLPSPFPGLQGRVIHVPSLGHDMSICAVQGVAWLVCSLSPAREMLPHILETKCTPMAKWNSKSTSLSWTDVREKQKMKQNLNQQKQKQKSNHK